MKVQCMATVAKVLAALTLMACLNGCRRAPESDAAGLPDPGAPALESEEGLSEAEKTKLARGRALEATNATKRAVEFAQSASAAAKNAAAAAERAAAAADAAVEAIRNIPREASQNATATPKPTK